MKPSALRKEPANKQIIRRGVLFPDDLASTDPTNCVKEVDFKHLQYVLALFVPNKGCDSDYHRVLKQINHNWATRLNF
jgi:hypothetical protein